MNKEKIKWLNFLLKFNSIDLSNLKWEEIGELADKLDLFIHNDTVTTPGTTIRNLVILDTSDGCFVDDYSDVSIKGELSISMREIQNKFKEDITSVMDLIETAGKNASTFKLERKYVSRYHLSVKSGTIYLMEGNGHTFNEILMFKFQKCISDLPITFFNKCPECEIWFVNATKRKKTYCTNKCATRFLMRKQRQEEKKSKSKKYQKKLKDASKRARKSYVKKVQNGNPDIKVASRPTKYKKGD